MENIQDIYPLSPMQEGMLFHTIYSDHENDYKEQFSCRLSGKLDLDAFKNSWQEVLNRHEILRSSFIWEDVDEPLQIVNKKVELPFQSEDISALDVSEKDKFIKEKLIQNLKTKFILTNAPLMSILLLKLNDEEHYLIWNYHHILFDGWGLPILMQEILSIYSSFVKNKPLDLKPTSSYKNYIAWLKNQDEERTKEFWQNRLQGLKEPTYLKLPLNTKPQNGYNRKGILLENSVYQNLISAVKNESLTINTIFQSVWALVLTHYLDKNDVVFGATFSGRNADVPGINQMIGLFINTLVIRAKFDFNKRVID